MTFKSDKVTNASIIFLLVALIQFLASFFMLPIYLNTFSVEEFGTNELINRLVLFLSIVVGLRVSGAMANIYFTFDDTIRKQQFVSSIAQFTILSGVGSSLVLFLLGYFALPYLLADGSFNMNVHGLCAILSALAGSLLSPYFFYLKNEQKLREFLALNCLFVGILIGLQLAAIYLFRANFDTVIQLRSGFSLFQIGLLLFLYKRRFSLSMDWALVRRALSYTVPLIPFLLLNWLQLYFDRFFVGKYLGAIALGLFSFILILQNIQTTLVDVFENAIRPALMNQFKRADSHSPTLTAVQNKYILAITASAAGMLFATILVPMITPDSLYVDRAALFFLIVPTGIAKGISLLFMQQLIFREKSIELLKLAALHVFCILVLYFLLLDYMTLATILLINLLVSCFMVFFYYQKAQQAQQVRFRLQQFYLPVLHIVVCVCCYFAHQAFDVSITKLLLAQLLAVMLPALILLYQSRKMRVEQSGIV